MNFTELVLCGYQGWFAAQGREPNTLGRWSHWSRKVPCAEGQFEGLSTVTENGKRYFVVPSIHAASFDLYPDVREYDAAVLEATELRKLPFSASQTAELFDTQREQVVAVHFDWMKRYRLDGVALQRFLDPVVSSPRNREWRNRVAGHVRSHAERTQRWFYVMYDLSTAPHRAVTPEQLMGDFQQDVEPNLLGSARYCRQLDGGVNKPVVALWGLGFANRTLTKDHALAMIQGLKDRGCYVAGGVPYHWRTNTAENGRGAHSIHTWGPVYEALDMLIPWSVGRFHTLADVQHAEAVWTGDCLWCDQRDIDIQRVIYPGFSWFNMKSLPIETKSADKDPRPFRISSHDTVGSSFGLRRVWSSRCECEARSSRCSTNTTKRRPSQRPPWTGRCSRWALETSATGRHRFF
jgi:hypothetical protein